MGVHMHNIYCAVLMHVHNMSLYAAARNTAGHTYNK